MNRSMLATGAWRAASRLRQLASLGIERTRQFWRPLIYVLTAGAVLYMAAILWFGQQQLHQVEWTHYVPAMLATLGIFIGAHLIQLVLWLRILASRHRVGWRDAEIYCRMILLRSLPGGVWHWVGRAAVYTVETTVPARTIVSANLLEWGMLILIGFGLALGLDTGQSLLLRSSIGVGLLALAAALAFRWQSGGHSSGWRLVESITWVTAYALTWVLGGWILAVFVQASGDYAVQWNDSIRIWALAGSASAIIAIVPAGLGLRELTLTWLLGPFVPGPVALVIALLMRLVFIFGDAIWGIGGWLVSHYAGKLFSGGKHGQV